MHRLTKTTTYVLACLILGLQALLPAAATAAGSAKLYLSPASGSVAKGSNLVVKVYEDSGSTGVNAVQANLTYSKSQLTYVSYSSSSAFSIEAENPSGNTGTLRFARGSITERKGAQLVVTITFRAAASSGTANVNFASGSQVISSSDNQNILTSSPGGKYTLKQASSSSSGSASSGSGSTASKGDKTPPKLSDIKVSDINETSAVISWKTDEPATSEVSYGEDTKNQISTTDTNLVKEHKVTIGFGALQQGKTYYFKVESVDAAGNKVLSKNLTFSTGASTPVPTAESDSANSNLGVIAAAAGGLAVLALSSVGSVLLIKRRRAQAELKKHFLNSDNGSNSPTPPATMPPSTVIQPDNSKKP